MNPEAQMLWDAVLANPDDTLVKAAYADQCEETGYPDIAYAVRWCVRHGKWPKVDGGLVAWSRGKEYFCLPLTVFINLGRLVGDNRYVVNYPTVGHAVADLTVALARAREDVG